MFWIFVVIVVGIGLVLVFIDEKETKERKDILETKINKLPNNGSFKKIFGHKNQYVFIIDNIGRIVYYLDSEQTKEIPFDQIISVEVIEDNSLLSSKSTTRTVGGALLGAALAGGAGMVVGGLSGDSSQKKKVSQVSVKIRIRDYSSPSLLIICFDAQKLTGHAEIKTNDNLYGQCYKEELQNARNIADYVSVIIDEVDKKEKQTLIQQPFSDNKHSVADELAKLAALKEQGILTEVEFQAQKDRILSQ